MEEAPFLTRPQNMQHSRMLSGCRALDLTDEKGFLCGKLLADLGVDVIKIEKPGGDSSRKTAPFAGGAADPGRSLYWHAYNSDKRGITLDIESGEGRLIFKDLVKTSDIVIESFRPGYMDSLQLGYSALTGIRSDIIVTSITPFGQSGPYRDFEASDMVLMGMAGVLYLTGDSDRRPVNMSLPQACLHAGADAAVGTMIAYHHRRKTGAGQHVDVSMQQSTAWFLAATIPYWEIEGTVMSRVGTFRSGSSRGGVQRQVWPCKDGYAFFFMIGGRQGAKTCRQLVNWMKDEGAHDDFLSSFEWEKFDMATVTQETVDRISKPIADFLLQHTTKEILEAAMTWNISICPLFSMKDILADANLKLRGFWCETEAPGIRGTMRIPYPRRFVRSSENDTATRFRAPGVGEHNESIFQGIGLTPDDLAGLKARGVI